MTDHVEAAAYVIIWTMLFAAVAATLLGVIYFSTQYYAGVAVIDGEVKQACMQQGGVYTNDTCVWSLKTQP